MTNQTIDDIYGRESKFIKTADIPKGQIVDAEIIKVEVRQIGNSMKIVLTLSNGKEFALNKTNAKQLASSLGTADYLKWVGAKFKLFRTTTQYQGMTTECIRVV